MRTIVDADCVVSATLVAVMVTEPVLKQKRTLAWLDAYICMHMHTYACSMQLPYRLLHHRFTSSGITRRIALAIRGHIACNSALRFGGKRTKSSRKAISCRRDQRAPRPVSRLPFTP